MRAGDEGWVAHKGDESSKECQILTRQLECTSRDTQSVRNTYKYRLYPTPEHERALATILWRCRARSNVALDERKTAWERCAVSLNYTHQANELPDFKAACPD
jgi:hypothetical protein